MWRDSVNPDILPSFLVAVNSHLATQDPTAASRVLTCIAKGENFTMTRMLLSTTDKSMVSEACAKLEKTHAEETKAIRDAYQV